MAADSSVTVVTLRCPVRDLGEPLGTETGLEIAASVFVPAPLPAAEGIPGGPWVLCCLPGGALNRSYYDLVNEGDTTFSFARQMAARGFVVVTTDQLGTGESSRPADGYGVTPDIIAAANAQAVGQVLSRLRAGVLDAAFPAMPDLVPVGVGHSLGAVCSILQQSRFRTYEALVLLGFGGAGFPSELNEAELALAGDGAAIRANIVRLARLRYAEPYGRIVASPRTREVYGGGGDRGAMVALRQAGTSLLSTAGLFSMIPGSTAAESASLDVPLFLGIGDRDICGPPHRVPACFPNSSDLTLYVMPATGHTHFVFPSSGALFARIADWVGSVLAPRRP